MQQEQEQQQQQPQRQLWWQHPQMQQQQQQQPPQMGQQPPQWQQPAPQSPLPRFASPMNQAPKALPPSETGEGKKPARVEWDPLDDALVLERVGQVCRPLHRLHLARTSPAPRLHSWHC